MKTKLSDSFLQNAEQNLTQQMELLHHQDSLPLIHLIRTVYGQFIVYLITTSKSWYQILIHLWVQNAGMTTSNHNTESSSIKGEYVDILHSLSTLFKKEIVHIFNFTRTYQLHQLIRVSIWHMNRSRLTRFHHTN